MGRNREKKEDERATNCEGDRKRNRLRAIYQEIQADCKKRDKDLSFQAVIEREKRDKEREIRRRQSRRRKEDRQEERDKNSA